MVQATVTRTESKRWAAALDRAIEEALDVLIEPISGEAFVESATQPGLLYQVSASTCSCPAGRRGLPCKHRACYLAQIDEFPMAIAVAPSPCSSCVSGKVQEWGVSGPIGCRDCGVCGGTGVITPVDAMPALQPQRERIAA